MPLPRTTEQEHAMARVSALHTVRHHGRATVAMVCREQGLCEIRARLALTQLVEMGKARKDRQWYCCV